MVTQVSRNETTKGNGNWPEKGEDADGGLGQLWRICEKIKSRKTKIIKQTIKLREYFTFIRVVVTTTSCELARCELPTKLCLSIIYGQFSVFSGRCGRALTIPSLFFTKKQVVEKQLLCLKR